MHEAIAKTVAYSDVTIDEAVGMATANPARLLGLANQRGSIAPGQFADLVLFNWDEATAMLEIVATIVAGQIVYRKE
jgi:N-acetylglucosamine-6-phosphate deacetylase